MISRLNSSLPASFTRIPRTAKRRHNLTSGRGVQPRPRATSDKRYCGQLVQNVVKSDAYLCSLDSTVTISDKIPPQVKSHRSRGQESKQRSPRASGNEPTRARLSQPSPSAGSPDKWPSEARGGRSPTVGSPHLEGLASSGVQLAPDDKGGLAAPSGELRREDHGDGSPSTVQAWFRQLETLGLSALLNRADLARSTPGPSPGPFPLPPLVPLNGLTAAGTVQVGRLSAIHHPTL